MSRHRSEAQLAAALGLGLLVGPTLAGPMVAADRPEGPEFRSSIPGEEEPGHLLARQGGGPAGVAMDQAFGRGGPLIPGTDLSREEIQRIDDELLENILQIEDPSQRTLALVQAAEYKILMRDLDVARRALAQAADSAREIVEPLRRDLRYIATSRAYVNLAEEEINSAVSGVTGMLSLEPDLGPEERLEALKRALDAYELANGLTANIQHHGYRPDAQYFAVERLAQGGQTIGNVAFRDPGLLVNQPDLLDDLKRLAGTCIERAAAYARTIPKPVWRDVALSTVSSAAASSNQFEQARQIARSIPELEIRFQALVVVAEAEARHGSADQATKDYAEAARTVASIPIHDLRGTLNDVLIESLIAAGRFPDARRCIGIYPDDIDRFEALGAIAQSMGSRGLSDEAREWILHEIPLKDRDTLYRRVNLGVLSTLERYGTEAYFGEGGY